MEEKSYFKEKKEIIYHVAIKPKGSLLWYGGYIKDINPVTENYDYIIVNKVPMYLGEAIFDHMEMKMAQGNVDKLKVLEVTEE